LRYKSEHIRDTVPGRRKYNNNKREQGPVYELDGLVYSVTVRNKKLDNQNV